MTDATQHAAMLQASLNTVKGVGPKFFEKLQRLGLQTIEDLLYFLPFRYEDRRHLSPISHVSPGESHLFAGKVLSAGEVANGRGRKKIFEVVVGDDSGQVLLKWFHYRRDWMKRRYQPSQQLVVFGEVKFFSGRREILHPEVQFCNSDNLSEEQLQIVPVYPLTDGLSQNQICKLSQQVAKEYAHYVDTHLPQYLRQRHQFKPLCEALQQLHNPSYDSDIQALQQGSDQSRCTLVYDEFFYFQLGLALRQQGVQLEQGRAFKLDHTFTKPLAKLLPFKLTQAQKRVLGEIKADMMAPHPMNRLLQGDVGSGKTIVALMAGLIALENGAQAAVVAPTEILAEQHYHQFQHWLSELGLQTALLTGSTPKKLRRQILEQLACGELHLLVGTHALFQDDVQFHDLGLAIIDEQHRFGVKQRQQLRKKGTNPDTLVMTATPIPRTLSLTLYGDLTVSIIDELPPGRTPIKTRIAHESQRQSLINFVKRELGKGHQVYFVYPLVEESESSELKAATQALEDLTTDLGGYRLGLLHGRLHPHDKEAVMRQFKEKELDLLVATTVIEVGIDVPNASVMVIEHAERFGLAQLHQLRGRVGRGATQSYCILVRSAQCSQDGQQRLSVMERSNDGFFIAQADLEQRGPGDFLGTRQAGLADFRIADILRDTRLLECARQDAFELAMQPDFMESQHYEPIRQTLKQRWGTRLELASVG